LVENAVIATERTAVAVETHVPPVVERQIAARVPEPAPQPPQTLPKSRNQASARTLQLRLNGQLWEVVIETNTDPAVADWLSYSKRDAADADKRTRYVDIRINLSHPFVDRFIGANQENVELFLRIAAALSLSLLSAQDVGMGKGNAVVLGNFNELLRDALSKAA
jgi:hypothetical protein